jgi:DNA primase
MPPSSLRLQIVRGLAKLTQTTPAEIEALFELAQPVARTKVAPPRVKRTPPMGLERQMIRLLVAHPALATGIDQVALDAVAQLSPDNAALLTQLIDYCLALGTQASLATLAEQLRATGADFEQIVAEIAAETESDPETARLELAGAVRQTKMQVLKAELERLATTGLATEEARSRYRELTQQQEQLRRQAEVENLPR